MSAQARFAYAQARLQARLGDSVTPEMTAQMHAARDLAGLLAVVRTTSLRRYASRLAPGLDPHELERHLRGEWIALVDEIASWQPREWRATVRWLRWLPSLPLLQKLARGGRPAAWARSDPWLGRVVAVEPGLRAAELAATPLRPLRAVFEQDDHDTLAAWLEHWRMSWPRDQEAAIALEAIVRDVAACGSALREPATRDSRDAQRALQRRLLRSFRRHPSSVAAAVAFIGLEGLAMLTLRGSVLRRAVVEPGPA
jgi:hypothetical protein